MKLETLGDLLADQVMDFYSAEKQLVRVLLNEEGETDEYSASGNADQPGNGQRLIEYSQPFLPIRYRIRLRRRQTQPFIRGDMS